MPSLTAVVRMANLRMLYQGGEKKNLEYKLTQRWMMVVGLEGC